MIILFSVLFLGAAVALAVFAQRRWPGFYQQGSKPLRALKLFATWLALLNWPPVLMLAPPFSLLAFLPYLLWLNVPGLLFRHLLGHGHFRVEEFGVIPTGILEWGLIALFWITAALAAAVTSMALTRKDKARP